MRPTDFRFTTNDGLELFARQYSPPGETKALICLVHGLGEHSGRHGHWSARLAAGGYTVFSMDLRGHGRSGGKRGHSPSFDHLADDLDYLVQKAETTCPGKPFFLYGNSFGGLIAMFYLALRRPDIAGAALNGPLLHIPLTQNRPLGLVVRTLAPVMRGLTIKNGIHPRSLSRDEAVGEAYLKDPMVHNRISIALGAGIIEATELVFKYAGELSLPLLIMHGGDDEVTLPSGSQALAEHYGGPCTLKIWDGLRHELQNETCENEVFAFFKEWLDSMVLTSGS